MSDTAGSYVDVRGSCGGKIDNPFEWITTDFRLRHKRDVEELQGDPKKASSCNAYSWIKKRLITAELAGNAENILEVGCGWGRNLACLPAAVGIDICLPFLRTARNYVSNELVLGTAYSLPFKDGAFLLVVMTEVIEHLEEPNGALREIKRVLSDEGRLLLSTPNKALSRFVRTPGHVHEMSYRELVACLVRHGFTVLARKGSTIPYPPSFSRLAWFDDKWFSFWPWKLLNSVLGIFGFLKWDIILLAEVNEIGTPAQAAQGADVAFRAHE